MKINSQAVEKLKERQDYTDSELKKVEDSLNDLQELIESYGLRIEAIEDKIEKYSHILSEKSRDISGNSKKIDAMQSSISGILKSDEAIHDRIDGLKDRMDALKERVDLRFEDRKLKVSIVFNIFMLVIALASAYIGYLSYSTTKENSTDTSEKTISPERQNNVEK